MCNTIDPPRIQISRIPDEERLIVQMGKKKWAMTYQEVFSLGHSVMQAGHFHTATVVFTALSRIRGRGLRAKIMLARCTAEIEDFDACSGILDKIFEGEDFPVAKELESAFVFHTMELRDEAIQEMLKVVKGFPDFPTAFLYLGDLFLEQGLTKKAIYCWKFAIKRDRKGGAISVTARKQLADLTAKQKKAKFTKSLEIQDACP